jgi:excisionase family DNA binding protein
VSVQKLDSEVVLLVSEVARLARVSEDTVRRETAAGKLRARKIGRCTRYLRTEADRWLADYGTLS